MAREAACCMCVILTLVLSAGLHSVGGAGSLGVHKLLASYIYHHYVGHPSVGVHFLKICMYLSQPLLYFQKGCFTGTAMM